MISSNRNAFPTVIAS